MDENKQSTEETTSADQMADVELQSPFLKKFENFMYYHKWHTVAALVLVFAIIVCILLLAVSTAMLVGESYNPFLYFRF